VSELHGYIAYSIPAAFVLLALWTVVAMVRNRPPSDWYWNLLAAIQIVLGVQVVVGGVLFALGGRPPGAGGPVWLHYAYGGLFPIVVLVVAHRVAAERLREVPYLAFGIAALVNFGLTFRALQTGLT
jgi:heme A synthase